MIISYESIQIFFKITKYIMCMYVLIFICFYVKDFYMFECWWILPAVLLLLLPWLKDWYRLIKQVFNSWNHPKNSEFSLQLRVYKGTRDVTAVGQFQGFPHKTDLVQTSEIPKTAFPLIPHLSSCIKALKSETKQIEWQTVHDIWSVNHTVWFEFT